MSICLLILEVDTSANGQNWNAAGIVLSASLFRSSLPQPTPLLFVWQPLLWSHGIYSLVHSSVISLRIPFLINCWFNIFAVNIHLFLTDTSMVSSVYVRYLIKLSNSTRTPSSALISSLPQVVRFIYVWLMPTHSKRIPCIVRSFFDIQLNSFSSLSCRHQDSNTSPTSDVCIAEIIYLVFRYEASIVLSRRRYSLFLFSFISSSLIPSASSIPWYLELDLGWMGIHLFSVFILQMYCSIFVCLSFS